METMVFGWMAQQTWWEIFTTVVAVANAITMTVKDSKAVKIPFIGKLWPVLNWLSLNINHNENKK